LLNTSHTTKALRRRETRYVVRVENLWRYPLGGSGRHLGDFDTVRRFPIEGRLSMGMFGEYQAFWSSFAAVAVSSLDFILRLIVFLTFLTTLGDVTIGRRTAMYQVLPLR
jgi:hypothetical protein